MAFGKEYSSDYAYFIAGGATLAAIKQYESDVKNRKELQQQIANEFGAEKASGVGEFMSLQFKKKIKNPALVLKDSYDDETHVYEPNRETPEGRALQARFADIPDFDLGQQVFARRLTGQQNEVKTNPDHLRDGVGEGSGHYRVNGSARAASFRKYGDTYVVSVPRVIRGIFNEESKKASIEDRYSQAAGYNYEWFTPPDSKLIPYSKVIALQEKEKGSQLKARTVKAKVPAFPSRD